LVLRKIEVVAATVAATFILTSCSGAGNQDASLPAGTAIRVPPEHGGVLVVPRAKAFTDGLEVIQVTGHSPIEIVDVGVLGATPGLEFLGARLGFQPNGTVAYQLLDGFPPADKKFVRIVPAVGATLEPLADSAHPPELLIGMRVNTSGVSSRKSIYVDYEAEGRRYRAIFPAELVVCSADVARDSKACSAQAGM